MKCLIGSPLGIKAAIRWNTWADSMTSIFDHFEFRQKKTTAYLGRCILSTWMKNRWANLLLTRAKMVVLHGLLNVDDVGIIMFFPTYEATSISVSSKTACVANALLWQTDNVKPQFESLFIANKGIAKTKWNITHKASRTESKEMAYGMETWKKSRWKMVSSFFSSLTFLHVQEKTSKLIQWHFDYYFNSYYWFLLTKFLIILTVLNVMFCQF